MIRNLMGSYNKLRRVNSFSECLYDN